MHSIPTYPEFKELFSKAVDGDIYKIRTSGTGYVAQFVGNYNYQELFALVIKLKVKWENGDEEAGELVSNIMSSLGVEWV